MDKRNRGTKERNGYQGWLDYLYGLEKFGMIFGLTQVERILEAIGNPHKEIQAIHIGGTNGKGSTASMMASILEKEGYRVGLYTSPHLIQFTERIKVNGREIDQAEVIELTGWIRGRVEEAGIPEPFTFFDFTTAMAFLYFSQQRVDLAIVEVGLGGRLDSTNVLDPLLSVVTNIARDHEDQLGKGILRIAGEKAGIIKKGRPFLTAAHQPRVLQLLAKTCQEKGAPFFRMGRDFHYRWSGEKDFTYVGIHRKLWGVQVNLKGSHQIVNATLALGALEVLDDLGYVVSTDAMMEGLRAVEWPGRLELISTSPKILLDGAHNPAGAWALREALEKEFHFRRLILVIGILKDKDIGSILNILFPLADHIILSQPHTDRAAPVQFLRKALGKSGTKADVVEDLETAIRKGLTLTGSDDLLCITGSLYMVGEAKAFFQSQGTA
jgi:dihydrofolate synthase / folylpolyglutamate synthase